MDKKLKSMIEKVVPLLRNRGAKRIAIFGSYVRGEAGPGSDLDILVRFSGGKSLLELVRMERELSEMLGVKVDLLTEKSISPYIIGKVKKQMEVVYQ